jgi:cytoskeletal protein CcmA (bactofilin family)
MLGKKDDGEVGRSGELNTIVGKGSQIEGTLKIQNSLRVDGKIKGNVAATDSIVVGKEGAIDGEVKVKNAVIGGHVKGKLVATGKVVLETQSRLEGELHTAKLVIDEGASFEGRCSMNGNEKVATKGRSVPEVVKRGDAKPEAELPVTGEVERS